MVLLPNMFHWKPSWRLACRLTSINRTSSMICCGCMTWTVLIGSGPNWRAIITALSRVTASGEVPLSMMRPLTEDTLTPPLVKRAISMASREMSYDTSTSKMPTCFLPSPYTVTRVVPIFLPRIDSA